MRAIHPAQQCTQEIPYIQARWCFHIFLLSNDLINAASRRPTSFNACCVAEMPSLVSTDYPKSCDELRVASDKHSTTVVVWGECRQSAHQIFLFVAAASTSFCHSPHTQPSDYLSHLLFRIFRCGALTPSAAVCCIFVWRRGVTSSSAAGFDQKILQLQCASGPMSWPPTTLSWNG